MIVRYDNICNQILEYNNNKLLENYINKENYILTITKYQKNLLEVINITKKNIQIKNYKKIYKILFNVSIISLNYLYIYKNKINDCEFIMNENRELFIRKNKDYGNSFEDFGLIGILVRINDKINRIKSLHENNSIEVKDEKIEDTLNDLYNYCILGLIHKD